MPNRLSCFLLGSLFFVACGTANIPFRFNYYHVAPADVWNYPGGALLGAASRDDKKLEECKPTVSEDGKRIQRCVVMTYPELSRLIDDYKKTKQELIDCQRR